MQDENVTHEPEMQEPVREQMVIAPEPTPGKKNFNTLLTILNIVMLLGLVVLYFIVLKPGNNGTPDMALIQKASSGSVTVAYVNSDSILEHYDLVKSMRDELEAKTARLEGELKQKQEAFEKDAAYFQEQVSKKAISESSAQEIYGQLMGEQQKLYELREKYSADLSKQEFDLNLLLLDSLNNFLKRYNSKVHFDYILSYNKGGSILSANDSLDITKDVIRLLNEEYAVSGK
ncbi:MAG: OmpH family outer membrane protein [Bacteroidales bacterium]|nr:OmpH family outer membrane protein [Bacteroidales bacterium]